MNESFPWGREDMNTSSPWGREDSLASIITPPLNPERFSLAQLRRSVRPSTRNQKSISNLSVTVHPHEVTKRQSKHKRTTQQSTFKDVRRGGRQIRKPERLGFDCTGALPDCVRS